MIVGDFVLGVNKAFPEIENSDYSFVFMCLLCISACIILYVLWKEYYPKLKVIYICFCEVINVRN